MFQKNCDVVVIGGGPAGLAAALSAKKNSAEKVLIIERDKSLGGILQQCIHPGFGLKYFKQELTGPEYSGKFIEELENTDIEVLLDTMVLEIEGSKIICVNSENGITEISSKSIILSMGCRERTRGSIQIPGTRPSGIYTAGSAQRLVNCQNRMVGKNVVILGSGDIGMIMARRMTLEGAKVTAVVEIADYLSGLTRNRVQCLDDFGIPLLLSHTITKIQGTGRLEGVWVSKVDENKKPLTKSEGFFPCDTLLLSVGLIPENEISKKSGIEINQVTAGPVVNQYMQTSQKNIFACGNVVHVNDLVDNVSLESEIAGKYAAFFANNNFPKENKEILPTVGKNIRYICPQKISLKEEDEKIKLYFRVLEPDLKVKINVSSSDKIIYSKKAIKVNPGEIEYVEINTKDILEDIKIYIEKEV